MIEIKRIETESGDIYKFILGKDECISIYADTDSVITKDEHYHRMIDNALCSSKYEDIDFEKFLLQYWLRSEYHIGNITLKEWCKYRTYLSKKYIERVIMDE